MLKTELEDGLQYLPAMTPKVLKLLMEEGITTLRRLSMVNYRDLADIDGISENRARKLVFQAREKLGMCDFITVDELEENWKWITTGSEAVDEIMGGGVTTGRITELFGAFKSGKTNFVNTLCITVQLPEEEGGLDGDVVYIDTEGTFSKAKIARIARRFGIEPKKALQRIHIAKVYSSDHQEQMIEKCEQVIQMYPVRLIVVDSLMALLRNEYVGIGSLVSRQAKLNRIIHLLSSIAESANVAVLLTNQVVTKMAGNVAYEDAVGGNIISHGCHFRFRLKAKGASYNETLERQITVVDSVDLPPGSVTFFITEAGIADSPKIHYKIKELSEYENQNNLARSEVKKTPQKETSTKTTKKSTSKTRKKS
ncbi:MAG: DNA repair and recombination protein RadA [Promethearchaeota archaeon]